MNLQKLNAQYSRAVFIAAFDYILGHMSINPAIKRIHFSAFTTPTKEATIVYSIGPEACTNLLIDDNGVSFTGRFKGVSTDVFVPWDQVMFIFCPEFGTPFIPNIHDPFGLSINYGTGVGGEIVDKEPVKKTSDVLEKRSKMKVLPS